MSRQKMTRLSMVPEPQDEERAVTHLAPLPHKRPGIERLQAALAEAEAAAAAEVPETHGRRKFRDQGPTLRGPQQRRKS